ncbi:hypothetical protein ACSU1N_04020 [Thermogladius sp. 4427co]|uniref:hypothetical protein n=1 Tax=Thermogladius sp. 4427co TaxID=3450718 RepID=UPI003F7A35FB
MSTIAFYWEYTRVLGESLALLASSLLVETLESGDLGEALKTGVVAGLTILTHLIASLELFLFASIALAYYFAKYIKLGIEPDAFRYVSKLALLAGVLAIAVAGWWLVPAVAPFGLAHYLLVETPVSVVSQVYSYSLSVNPPHWAPAVQLPYLLAGVSGFIYTAYRKRLGILHYYTLALLALTFLYGQGPRLIPTLGFNLLVLAFSSTNFLRGVTKYIVLTALAALVLYYVALYTPEYWRGLSVDYTYVGSDDYKIALYLEKVGVEGRVYAMYGDEYHGNQWLNVFAPRVK